MSRRLDPAAVSDTGPSQPGIGGGLAARTGAVLTSQSQYGENYYRCHCGPLPYDRSCAHWATFFGGIADTLIRSFRPARVFDAGCALGFLVEAFWDRGVEAWGRDISDFAISEVRVDLRAFCAAGSIADPIEGRFDLVTCIEVVEHMPEDLAVLAIQAMTKATDRILFSSSPTDLDEPTHVNVKPVIYWLRLFAAEGFEPVVAYDPTYVTPHCVVLERSAQPPSEQVLRGYAEIVRLRLEQAARDQTIRDLYAARGAADQATQAAVQATAVVAAERDHLLAELGAARASAADLALSRTGLHTALDEATRLAERQAAESAAAVALAAAEADGLRNDVAGLRTETHDLQRQLAHQSRQVAARAAQAARQQASAADRLATLTAELARAEAAYRAVVMSPAWRGSLPLQRMATRVPRRLRRLVFKGAKVAWWTMSLQLAARLRQRHAPAPAIPALPQLAPPMEPDLEAAWYLAHNPDLRETGMDAREHYRDYGREEGRSWGVPDPATLMRQGQLYKAQYPDVAAGGMDPLAHYLQFGAAEQRTWPNATDADALEREGIDYLARNADVVAGGMDPWHHFQEHGIAEGRTWTVSSHPSWTRPSKTDLGRSELTAEERAADELPWVNVLRIVVDPALSGQPRLNVLVPGLAMRHMSGGPNTAVNLACRLAAAGIAVRLVSTAASPDDDPAEFWRHAAMLAEADPVALGVELVDASDHRACHIGENDLFMATAWWTAQAAKYATRHTRHKRFLYLIQDYEALLHPASTQQALAEETYHLDHLPIINSTLLQDYLVQQRIGRFADPGFAAGAFAFEPAVDAELFRPAAGGQSARRRLLFYARPSNGLRNLFELGVAALRTMIATGAIDGAAWEFCGMGEAFDPVDLGAGCQLVPLPWQDLATYAEQMRTSDVLLSLMLSPHPSYPPLEMAACGRPVVTTVFGNKDAARLRAVSPNIIGVDPTIEGLVAGLSQAIRQGPAESGIALPRSWAASLDGLVPRVLAATLALMGAPGHRWLLDGPGHDGVLPGFDRWPADSYGVYRQAMLADRAPFYRRAEPGLLSFVSTVWNTAPHFLVELAETVFGQDSGPGFEWVILDNGSADPGTRATLATIAQNPAVRLFRVERNAGIVPGMRMVLEHARNRYILPLDSDDLLTPDCVRIVTSALAAAGYPLLAYSDEDKQLAGRQRDPYCKPDWDPVLFTHSCYIAHLCAIDREAALRLGCYTNPGVEGSHDWDSFTRFLLDGQTPLHVPELLYTWRMHAQSTSLDMGSKSFIHESQRAVLGAFLQGRGMAARYSLAFSPLFGGTPDWRFVRDPGASRPVTTLPFGPGADAADLAALLHHAKRAAAEGRLLHLLAPGATVTDDSWADEALAMVELFPGTAMVGGRIHRDGRVVAADAYFGFDGPCGSPNIGRPLTDPGYFAQALKPHAASAVPLQHCVIDAAFLVEVLPGLIAKGVGTGFLSAWLGAAARERGLRCVYSPFLSASLQHDPAPPPPGEVAAFALAHAALIPDSALLSPRLGLTRATSYLPVLRAERAAQAQAARSVADLPYPALHEAELLARRTQAAPGAQADLSVLTTVYIRTDAALFRATAAALLAQTVPPAEWLILAHGPVTPALEQELAALAGNDRIKLLRHDTNLGIVGGMRVCLEAASSRLVLPLDADDLLTADALQIMVQPFEGDKQAAFAFSDEDILLGAELRSPIRRAAFDPVLNDEDSTIWHLCAFDRAAALRLGVYSDGGAEYCHDWDTVQRFAAAGLPIAHVPHVLYHWRHHAVSMSNSGSLSEGSLGSVRHVLAALRARQADPALYEVAPYPISRGVTQLALLRRHAAPLPLCLIYLSDDGAPVPETLAALPVAERHALRRHPGALAAVLDQIRSAHVVLLDEAVRPSNPDGLWDAMRLFELHGDVAAVAGRILDPAGRVVACCDTVLAGRATWLGHARTDPGDQALALKAQTATALPDGYIVCTTALLLEAAGSDATSLPAALADAASRLGLRLAYSPLMEATRL